MHVDKTRNELLLKEDLTLQKVKEICNKYESARAAASKILQRTEPELISQVDEVAEKYSGDYSQEGEQENIDRVGGSNYGSSFNAGFRSRIWERARKKKRLLHVWRIWT